MRFPLLKVLKIVLVCFFSAVLISAGIGYYIYQEFYLKALETPYDSNAKADRFEIKYGESFYTVASNLQNAQLVSDERILKLYARLNPDKINIKAGEYQVSAAMSPLELVEKFIAGDIILYSVTFPEGLTIKEMATTWERSGYGTADKFLAAVDSYNDPEIVRPVSGWEGYLFPETYTFPHSFTEKELVQQMVAQLKSVLKPEYLTAAQTHGLERHQVMTLASLIEKETRLEDEHGLVSAVFHNRLKKGMLLQCDPTVIYALGDSYTGRLLRKHLNVDSPYNTYRYPELPPGPIAAPGHKALEAACFPADTRYLYFVADNTGGHTFSHTLKEHNKAVQAYRRGLKRK